MPLDPEVQALLDDLPPPSLPDALRAEGWGAFSMRQIGKTAIKPQPPELQSPDFCHRCVQCGLELATDRQGAARDRIGNVRCDRVLLPKDLLGDTPRIHVIEGEREDTVAYIDRWRYHIEAQAQRAAAPARVSFDDIMRAVQHYYPTAHDCQARGRHNVSHTCQCRHEGGHFGFHECKHEPCRRLWR